MCFAPAMPQRVAFFLIDKITAEGMEATFLKILALRSFQISQAARRSKEERPLRRLPCTPVIEHHHSSTVPKLLQREISKSSKPSQSLSPLQIRVEYRHWNKRCTAVSGSLLHSWQTPQFGHPRRVRRSAVHTLFWRINHAKSLHLGGAQL